MTKAKPFIWLTAGILIGLLLFKVFSLGKSTGKEGIDESYVLRNQIEHLNKMVVMEQNFTTLNNRKINFKVFGANVSEKELTAVTTTTAQVSYDLNKMKVQVDTINKKLIIEELPEPQITIRPAVEIRGMDDSFFDRIGEDEVKSITGKAKADAIARVDQEKLLADGKVQLHKNLDQLFVLAKALHYTIEDRTQTFKL